VRFWFGAMALVLTVLGLAAPACIGGEAMVVYSDGRPSEKIEVVEKAGAACLGVSEIARLLRLERVAEPGQDKVTLRTQSHYVEIIVGGTVWATDGEAVKVAAEAYREGDDVIVSLADAEGILAQAFGKSLRWDAERRRLLVGIPAPNIIDLAVESGPDLVTATILTVGPLRYEMLPPTDNKLEILVRGGVYSRQLGFEAEGGLVERVAVRQEAEGVRFTVTLGPDSPAYRVYPRWSPDGIVVKVWTRVAGEIPEPELKPPRRLALEERFSAERAVLDVVVIDPGHGGTNRGSLGATGFLEKELNLELARRLRSALEAQGITVIMTRNDDVTVPIETRTEVANSTGADLLISLHANGFASPSAKGFEVYFLSPAVDEEARFVAAAENSAIEPVAMLPEASDEVAFILWDTAQNEFVAESSYLAQLVNEEMARVITIPNRGVKQADFSVLKGAYVPGILVESAFITNPQEEAMLRDADFQERVAKAVAAAVARFKQEYRR
jgi:N-acetylmuramoyl-L-alanine amidase